jgi:hypothetical protein
MTWGNNGAVPGAQPPAVQPVGVQPFAPGQVGQPPAQAGATLPACYNSSFESLMAAVSRGEVSLNQVVANGSQFGGLNNGPAGSNISAGNPTLLQGMSQGNGQNGTNGINGVGAGGGTVNSSIASVNTAPGTFGVSGQTNTVSPRAMMSDVIASAVVSPYQYGGN